jgi:[acyl-carrier-protein] S-malonyltransferase
MKFTTAFIFPGQGSQQVGMLSELANAYPEVKLSFEEVSNRVNYDVWQLIQEGPVDQLNQTAHTQVAVLTADVAIYRLITQRFGVQSSIMAGHSLGEYAALVCANSIGLPDAAELVAKRGQLMQETVPLGIGAMAAIVGLSDETVESICLQVSSASEQVAPANFNAIDQVVVAGHVSAIERVILLAEKEGARLAKVIPVSVPCHCALLTDAALKYEAILNVAPFVKPEWPVVSNVDLSIYSSAKQIKELLKAQLYSPVRWVETIQKMKQTGVGYVIECGPGKVLSGLVKRIDNTLQTFSVNDPASLEKMSLLL